MSNPPTRDDGRGPFGWLADHARTTFLLTLTGILVALSLALAKIAAPLITEAAPQGIVTFELARTPEAATAVVSSWSPAAREAAMLSLGLDYLYLLVYPAWLAFVCDAIARARRGAVAGLGRRLAWAVLAAAPLDAIENFALVQVLNAPAPGSWPALAWACAVPKFLLVFAALGFAAVAGLPLLLRRALGR